MPSDHAKLSPSAAPRWMICPGSCVLSEGMTQASSPHAAEGTQAHSFAEQWLNEGVAPFLPTHPMHDHLKVYVDYVRSVAVPGTTLAIEQRVSVTKNCWGTADAIVWDPMTKTLHIIDLKYGAGVGVEVHGNLQLKIYALAALLTMGYPAETVCATIVQPRMPHSDGLARSMDFDALDLIDFHADLMDAAKRVGEAFEKAEEPCGTTGAWIDTYLTPSEKGCRWCLAAPKCPKLRAKGQEIAKQVFAADVPYDPKALAETLDFLPILEGWIKNTREFAYAEAEKGNEIPDYKLVEKRATRKWRDNIDAAFLATRIGASLSDVLKPAEFRPVGDILKITPGKNAAEREAMIDAFTTKESSGHTLVHVSDKREAVRIDAKSVFS